MKRILLATLAAMSVIAGFWLGGFNFNERGWAAATCYIWSIAAFAAVITYPKS